MRFEFTPSVEVAGLHLREATAEDYSFLRSLYRDVRSEELSATGWPQSATDAFCDSQFELQDKHYRAHYPNAHFYVVEKNGAPVGRIYVSDELEVLRLMEVSLQHATRGQGLGNLLMRWLIDVADVSSRRMELHVEPNNPAKRLYERFGFVPLEQTGVYLKMQRPPAQRAT